SPYAAPVLLVKKKDGSLRFVTDFRKLNEVTQLSGFPLPRIDDLLDSIGANNKYFSSLDMKSGFFGVKIDPADRHKTGFVTPDGHFEYERMGQGMKQSPLTYQMLISAVLSGLVLTGTVASYIDDIVIATPDVDAHLLALDAVLDRLRAANLTLHPGKCRFLQTEIEIFGFLIDKDGIRPSPYKVAALADLPPPVVVKQVRSFHGMASFYRRFVPKFSDRIRPLTELMQKDCKDIPGQWGEGQQSAFDDIKQALLTSPILCHFDPYLPVVVKADASDIAIGGVICQKQRNGAVLPIAYASRMLSKAERNYTITEKEALAVIWLLESHRPYLYGTDVVIETDHQALKWLEQTPARSK